VTGGGGYSRAMKVVRGRQRIAAELGRPLRAPTVAIGNFDGVHRGHQALVAAARDGAHAASGEAVVLTFHPHPASFFAPHLAPPLILSIERRLELLAEAGADVTVIEPFDAAFAAIEAQDFVHGVLGRDLGARQVVIGYDFSFGHGRHGTPALLTSMGQGLGMKVTVVPAVMAEGVLCSSTKIREFVHEGRVDGARLLLGRPFEVTGEVVRGAGRGRGLGIPTANLRVEGELLPRTGIYAARAHTPDDGGAVSRAAAVSIGTNPTFVPDGLSREVTIEAHLLDFEGDLYGRRLRLELLARLRDEHRFPSIDELLVAIHKDIARTREIAQ
jgi:riboflavin kinase / FMN adenylyltransferase